MVMTGGMVLMGTPVCEPPKISDTYQPTIGGSPNRNWLVNGVWFSFPSYKFTCGTTSK